MHIDRLISALNKYWRPLKESEYLDEMDTIDVNNAIYVSGMPKEVINWVWEKKRVLGEIF